MHEEACDRRPGTERKAEEAPGRCHGGEVGRLMPPELHDDGESRGEMFIGEGDSISFLFFDLQ